MSQKSGAKDDRKVMRMRVRVSALGLVSGSQAFILCLILRDESLITKLFKRLYIK